MTLLLLSLVLLHARSLYDSITTPDDTVIADHKSDSGYSMDVDAALKHNYSEASSQSAVGFPWADDLIGAYLRERLRMQETPSERNESPSSDANNDERPEVKKRRLDHVEAGASGVKEEPMELKEGSGSPGQPYSRMLSASEQQRQMQQRRRQLLLDAGKIKTEGEALNQQGVPEHLPIPLGIFLVGMITSSAFTNTQLHIEDLCLMSININIFGESISWHRLYYLDSFLFSHANRLSQDLVLDPSRERPSLQSFRRDHDVWRQGRPLYESSGPLPA